MSRPTPVENEVLFDGGFMITETDLQGRITFVNRKFIEMSGYTKEELLGKSHSIVRHPDMPRCCFKNMWETLRQGNPWQGYVKNLRKDGAYYWVIVYVSPKTDDNGNIIGYIAARSVPEKQTLEDIKHKYNEMLTKECREQDNSGEFFGNLVLQKSISPELASALP